MCRHVTPARSSKVQSNGHAALEGMRTREVASSDARLARISRRRAAAPDILATIAPLDSATANLVPDPLATRLRRLAPDAIGLTAAALYGLPTLAYAYGRDQAIFHYMGREWLAGTLPYRDAFDTKPPGIYLLHSVLIALFGSHLWTIRAAELVAVLGIGVLAALAVRRDTPRRAGELGLAAVLSASLYYSNFDWWDAGQVELWEGLGLLAAYTVLERDPNRERGALLGGVLAALAFVFKFTAVVAAAPLALLLAARAYREGDSSSRMRRALGLVALYTLGHALPVLAFFGYFALQGAYPALLELFAFLRKYATVWVPEAPGELVLTFFRRAELWVFGFAGAWYFARSRARREGRMELVEGTTVAMAMLLASIATVAVQRKFFAYHWGVVVPFLVLIAAYGVAEGARVDWPRTRAAIAALVVLGFLLAPTWLSNDRYSYRSYVSGPWWRHIVLGHPGPWRFSRVFVGMGDYSWRNQLRIANAIKERVKPFDLLHVRGFELGMYVLTDLDTPTRFVTEVLLDDPELLEDDDPRITAHEETLWRVRPRFIVSFDDREDDLEAIRAHGYKKRKRAGMFVLFERRD